MKITIETDPLTENIPDKGLMIIITSVNEAEKWTEDFEKLCMEED